MARYCLMYVFSPDYQQVALLTKKAGPAHLIGKLTGIGGHIEEGETPVEAAAREMAEEADLRIALEDWLSMGVTGGDGWELNVFTAVADLTHARTMTAEPIHVLSVHDVLQTCHLFPEQVANDLCHFLTAALAHHKQTPPIGCPALH